MPGGPTAVRRSAPKSRAGSSVPTAGARLELAELREYLTGTLARY